MPNLLITPSAVAKMAAVAMRNRLIGGSYANREVEQVFGDKIGDTVRVKVAPAVQDAQEFVSTTSASDVTQRYADVKLEKHFYDKATLSTAEVSLELDDLFSTVIEPKVSNIAQSINKYILKKFVAGFAANVSGSVAARPSTEAHIAAAQKVLDDAYIGSNRVALVDSTVKASLMQLAKFGSSDYGVNAADLASWQLGTKLGAEWVMDPALGLFVQGDIGGTVKASGSAGAYTVALSALTEATGVINEGTVFVVAGDTQRYVVTATTAIAANAVAALPIYPALATSPSTAGVTFESAGYSNLIFTPAATAAAIIAPAPLWGTQSAVSTFDGVSVRVSWDSSTSTLANNVVIDVMVGAKVVQPEGGVRFCG